MTVRLDGFRLACFVALGEELHFGRAAARCHISQPAMTQQIQKLEGELGVELVHRTKRVVRLTHSGQLFLERAKRIERLSIEAIGLARQANDGITGQLTIGMTSPALFVLFPDIAAALRSQAPAIELVVHEMSTADQEQALIREEIDVGVAHPPFEDVRIACRVVAKPKFNLVLSDDHPFSRRQAVPMADLAAERLILFPRRVAPTAYDTILAMCSAGSRSPRVVTEAYPAQSIAALAAAGLGIGFISSPLKIHRPGLRYLPILGDCPRLALGVAYTQSNEAPLVQRFLRITEDVAHGLND